LIILIKSVARSARGMVSTIVVAFYNSGSNVRIVQAKVESPPYLLGTK